MKTILKPVSVLVLLIGMATLSGCNTVAGFGQDLQSSGKALTKAADKNKTRPASTTSTSATTTGNQ